MRYRQDWTISRREGDGWLLLFPETRWREGALSLTLAAGRYRLTTSARLPSGDQLAARCELTLNGGGELAVPLRLRRAAPEELLSSQPLPALPAQALDGRRIPNLFESRGRPLLTLWLEEGGEPTQHVLNELLEHREALRALPADLQFLLRDRKSLAQPTLAKALAELDGARALLDDWAYDLEAVARCLGRDPDAAPLMVVSDGAGRAAYSDSGYRVGAVELLLRAAGLLCPEP